MFDRFYKIQYANEKEIGVLGVMPGGDEKFFQTVDEYVAAYKAEEDEFIDEMARLEEENFVEYPEEWPEASWLKGA